MDADAVARFEDKFGQGLRNLADAMLMLAELGYAKGAAQSLPSAPSGTKPPKVASKAAAAGMAAIAADAADAAAGNAAASNEEPCQCVAWRGADAECPNDGPDVEMASSKTKVPKDASNPTGPKRMIVMTKACRKEYEKLTKPKRVRSKPASAGAAATAEGTPGKKGKKAPASSSPTDPTPKKKSKAAPPPSADEEEEEEEQEEEPVVERYEEDEEEAGDDDLNM